MRKIEEAMCAAVKEHRYWKSGNTEVNVRMDYLGMEHIEVRLHGNMIWRYNEAEDMTEFTLAGWNTNTTRSYEPFVDGQMIDEDEWYEIRNGKLVK